MAYDEDYRTAVFGKTERTVGWEGNGEPTPYWSLSHSFTLDFIVTAKSKRLLEEQVKPAIDTFLAARGLKLSEEKTVITHIKQGFTFLGQSFRKQGNVLHIKPSQSAVLSIIKGKFKKILTFLRLSSKI